ncbi:MAG: NAD(P)/FAD-dependent oxidoreductase [Pseudomonadota bacterium]
MQAPEADLRIAIIGAGMSGILCAIRLREEGFSNIVIYEKAETLGGTWRENRYPGLSCDIPSHVYAYSFAPNPDWSQKYSPGPEIQAYLQGIADDFDVRSVMHFDHEITRMVFEQDHWRLWSHARELPAADAVLAATGILHHPRIPHFDGLDTFAGQAFHTARWPDGVTLDGQRVGIIGTGSTAVQIVNDVVSRVDSLTLFQRTAQWIWPEANAYYSDDDKARFREEPELLAHMRKRMSHVIDNRFSNALVSVGSDEMALIEAECRRNLDDNLHDPVLREKLTPDYRAGCKRLIMADGFYANMQRPNADVCVEAIDCIEPTGIRTADGEFHELDVIVLATGFNAHQFMRPMQIEGVDGVTLEQYWSDSVRAYRSISMPGFPNFFMLMGPQSPVGNFSLIDVAEIQFNYIVQLLHKLSEDACSAVQPTAAATERFTAEVIAAMQNTIWVTGCASWYLDERGVPITWPWTVQDFAASMQEVVWDDYQRSV